MTEEMEPMVKPMISLVLKDAIWKHKSTHWYFVTIWPKQISFVVNLFTWTKHTKESKFCFLTVPYDKHFKCTSITNNFTPTRLAVNFSAHRPLWLVVFHSPVPTPSHCHCHFTAMPPTWSPYPHCCSWLCPLRTHPKVFVKPPCQHSKPQRHSSVIASLLSPPVALLYYYRFPSPTSPTHLPHYRHCHLSAILVPPPYPPNVVD